MSCELGPQKPPRVLKWIKNLFVNFLGISPFDLPIFLFQNEAWMINNLFPLLKVSYHHFATLKNRFPAFSSILQLFVLAFLGCLRMSIGVEIVRLMILKLLVTTGT